MSDERDDHDKPEYHEHHHSGTSATPASNQNLIIGIVLGAVVLLLLLLVITQQLNKKDDPAEEDRELAELKKKIEEGEDRNDAIRFAGIAGPGQNPDILVNQIKADTDTLARMINASESDAAKLRIAQEDASRLSRINSDLQDQLRQYQAAAGRVSDLERQLEDARRAAQGMVDKGTADELRRQLTLAKNDRDRVQQELNRVLAAQGDMVDRNTYNLIKTENEDLRKQIRDLRAEIQRLRALADSRLFVTGEDVSPRAVALYRELKRIESDDHAARKQTYQRFDSQLKASVEEAITFPTGSADIAPEHEAHLKDVVTKAPAGAFFLVVGYASPSGGSADNEELSSRRATRVASMVNFLKKSNHEVQAVYLGEGNRFGPTEAPNQVCEVWQIRP